MRRHHRPRRGQRPIDVADLIIYGELRTWTSEGSAGKTTVSG
jgi:hypothetical protein